MKNKVNPLTARQAFEEACVHGRVLRYIVYKATCDVTGLVYIGMTSQDLRKRISQHKRDAFRKGARVNAAVKEHGIESFRFEMVSQHGSHAECSAAEEAAIAAHGSTNPSAGYNTSSRSSGSDPGEKNPLFGRKLSAETRELYSICKRGERHPQYGIRGKNSHKHDKRVFTFSHQEYGRFIGTQLDLYTTYNLARSKVSMVCSGKAKSCKGWVVV